MARPLTGDLLRHAPVWILERLLGEIRWITIPPPRYSRHSDGVDHEADAEWITDWAALKSEKEATCRMGRRRPSDLLVPALLFGCRFFVPGFAGFHLKPSGVEAVRRRALQVFTDVREGGAGVLDAADELA